MSDAKLTSGSIPRHVLHMTIPMIIGILAVYIFSFADTYFVAQLGTNELAALSFTFPVVSIFFALVFGIGHGASSVISRALGAGNREDAVRYTTDSMLLGVAVSIVIIILGIVTIRPLFTLLGAGEEILPYIERYMLIWYLGAIFLVVPILGNTAIRATGNTTFPAIIMVIAAIINIVLDPLLIFGLGPFPEMDLEGAAYATLFARALTFIAAIYFLNRKLFLVDWRRFLFFRYLRDIWASWKKIMHVGVPAAGAGIVEPMTVAIITWMLAGYGADIVAGFGIAARVENLALVLIYALATAIGPVAGQNYGAGLHDRVDRTFKTAYVVCIAWGVFIAAVLWFFGSTIVGWFDSADSVSKAAILYLSIVPVAYAAKGIVLVTSYAYNAIGQPKPSVVLIVLKMFILYIPLAYLLQIPFGYKGIFLANMISSFIAAGYAYYLYRRACKSCAVEENTA